MPQMIGTALALAARGVHVFPCLPRDKRPATGRGCKDATIDLEIIRQWWHAEPAYNVAAATGGISGIFAIDIDGLDAECELRRLEAAHGALPSTVESVTPRGRHLLFRWPGKPVRNTTSRIAPGVDSRGDNGYVVMPPSVHPTGRRYCWSVDSASSFAAAPAWLLAKVAEPRTGDGNGSTPPAAPSEWRALIADGVDEGQRDNAATRLAGYLLRHHIEPTVALETLRLWNEARCRPPLPMQDIERIADSVARMEARRRYGNGS